MVARVHLSVDTNMAMASHPSKMRRSILILTLSQTLFFHGSLLIAQSPGQQLADVDGAPITDEEVSRAIGKPLARLEEQIYALKQQKLDSLIAERLLSAEASRRNVTVAKLLDAEITSKVTLVTETELDDYCAKNRAACEPLRDDDAASRRESVRSRLQTEKIAARRTEYVNLLRRTADVKVFLTPPATFRAEITAGSIPARGLSTAKVTIVEFSDFHCPFCKRTQAALARVRETYGDRVRIVYRDFPLVQLHPQARRAAQAARCAGDQGKYWEMHDAIYAGDANSSDGYVTGLATKIGADAPALLACLNAGAHDTAIQKDIDEGTALGVTGTPTFFVNGRAVFGAQPYEAFAKIIDDELSRAAAQPEARPK
jgi:protein-disulfide isomerase